MLYLLKPSATNFLSKRAAKGLSFLSELLFGLRRCFLFVGAHFKTFSLV